MPYWSPGKSGQKFQIKAVDFLRCVWKKTSSAFKKSCFRTIVVSLQCWNCSMFREKEEPHFQGRWDMLKLPSTLCCRTVSATFELYNNYMVMHCVLVHPSYEMFDYMTIFHIYVWLLQLQHARLLKICLWRMICQLLLRATCRNCNRNHNKYIAYIYRGRERFLYIHIYHYVSMYMMYIWSMVSGLKMSLSSDMSIYVNFRPKANALRSSQSSPGLSTHQPKQTDLNI